MKNKIIGLVDVDSHNFPNLALMKISSYHQKKGDKVEFATMFENYDILYKSKIFTFTADDQYIYRADKIIKGGSGYCLKTVLPDLIDKIEPDYDLYNCSKAYGFLTRGCIRKCFFCFVPEKEGAIRPCDDIDKILQNKKSAVLLDNNVLSHKWGIKQIKKIIKKEIKIDFNQGLDARIISSDVQIAKLLSKIKWLKPLRMACDDLKMIPFLEKAIKLLRENNCTPKKYFVYVLLKNDVRETLEIVEFLRASNCDPFVQVLRDRKGSKPTYLQKQFCRYVNNKAVFNSVSWKNYKYNFEEN